MHDETAREQSMQMDIDRSGSDLFFMFISLVLFAYFGFFLNLQTVTAQGAAVPVWVFFVWLTRAGAIGFAVAIALRFVSHVASEFMYAIVGLLTAVGLVVLGVMDIQDKAHAAAIQPFWAFAFAAFNGYGSLVGLRTAMRMRAVRQMRAEYP
jgi:hypothetical protein